MTPTEQLVCNAQQIQRCLRKGGIDPGAALIAAFYQLANMSISCETLQANAAQYSCIARQNQLPVLIWLATQIVSSQIVPAGVGVIYQGIGSPVGVIAPPQPVALYIDNTAPTQPDFWNWNGTSWNQFLG